MRSERDLLATIRGAFPDAAATLACLGNVPRAPGPDALRRALHDALADLAGETGLEVRAHR